MSDYFDRQGNPMTLREWSGKFGDADYKRVAWDDIGGGVVVSTVWLGLNHQFGKGPPLIFETMIFGGPHSDWTMRYTTTGEALRGHNAVVANLRAGKEPE